MSTSAAQLLRRLEPAVRAVGECAPRAINPIETLDFASLLERADRGAIGSSAPVDVAKMRIAPTPEELARLGVALDLLLARGSRRAVIILGGQALITNVQNRTVERALDAQDSPSDPVDVDAALRIASPADGAPIRFLGPPAAIRHQSTVDSSTDLDEAHDSHSRPRPDVRSRAVGS